MRRLAFVSALLTSLAATSVAQSAEITQLWQTTGFDLPESVSWDQDAQVFFVSNIGGDPMSKDGNGTISTVNPDGSIADAAWASGLDAPKGIDIVDGTLYVSDIDHVASFDVASGKRLADYPVPDAAFLNDVYAAPDGRVFVSDTFGNAVFVIESGKVTLVARDPLLTGANGLTMIGNDLIVADLGDATNGFDKIVPGTVVKIDLATNTVSYFGSSDALGVLDGIEPDGQNVLVTDNAGGRLLMMAPGEAGVEVGKLAPGAADLEYVPAEQLIVVPQTRTNTIVAYRWTP